MPLRFNTIYCGPKEKCELVIDVCKSVQFGLSRRMKVSGWTHLDIGFYEWLVIVIGELQECDIAYLRAFADGVVAGAATDAV